MNLPGAAFWRGRRVLVTGHTGFKGGWLAAWLIDLGAAVSGLALAAEAGDGAPVFFNRCALGQRMASHLVDIASYGGLCEVMAQCRPEVVFHLAAQSLVRRSYREPRQTFTTNLLGTVNLLEALRQTPSVRSVVIVTSDKCYENSGRPRAYRETDNLGGHDPYSASKGCAELATAAYRHAFFARPGAAAIATVRAGNVIGGGDWGEDRLVPDAIRALHRGEALMVRNPEAIRPWQHVLEPLAGYLMLAERLYLYGSQWAGAWNFGPSERSMVPVGVLADMLVERWGGGSWRLMAGASDAPHEAACLKLDSAKARGLLGWRPRLTLERAIDLTVEWYRRALSEPERDCFELTRSHLRRYREWQATDKGEV